ncbi:YrhB domain-containing protein [Streptomyces buecherae]|uniref:YrhB domain-containing protein n=1 Tax=Streptomyces buecherae TaxID=2763006 RepID=UPI001C260BC8|nr:YrhB domain-containing protein [Streptomyces buecherae]
MIEESEARALAAEFAKGKSLEMELAIAPEPPVRRGTVAYFACQSAEFLRTGNWRDMAIGNGPVAVDLVTGECHMLGAAEAAEMGL